MNLESDTFAVWRLFYFVKLKCDAIKGINTLEIEFPMNDHSSVLIFLNVQNYYFIFDNDGL